MNNTIKLFNWPRSSGLGEIDWLHCVSAQSCKRTEHTMSTRKPEPAQEKWYVGLSLYMSLVVRKPVFGVSDLVRHKPGRTTTEDGYRLEISDLDRREIVLSM